MKKYALTFIFTLLAVLVSTANINAASSIFASASPFEIDNLQQNVFNSNPQKRYTLTITNRSKWIVDEVYFESSENQDSWGKDMLGRDTLGTDEYFSITNIVAGNYDVKFVDEEGDECILYDIGITKNTSWELTTKWLEKCEGY